MVFKRWKKLKILENDLYALKAERSEKSRRQYKSLDRSMYRKETGLETILEMVLDIHKIKTEEQQEDPTGLETNLEKI